MTSLALSAQSAPVLRLGSDVWSLLSALLDAGDVVRLLATGNRQFTDRVRLGARTFSVEWISCRYIQLDRVLEAASGIKSLHSLIFSEPRHRICCWTPISWTLLPPGLTSLSLTFVGAPGYVLQSEVTQSLSPSLTNLELVDKFHSLSEEYDYIEVTPPTIDLQTLPPSLHRLHIRSSRSLAMDPSHLPLLPPHLETLVLDFPPTFPEETPRNDRERVVFPSLPNSITKLKFKDNIQGHWHIDCATLPSSLETLTFNVQSFIAVCGGVRSHNCTNFDLEGMATHLTRLVEFSAQDLHVSASNVIRWIPPSVSRLRISIKNDGTEELATRLATHIGHSLVEHYPDFTTLDDVILNGKHDFAQLKLLRLRVYAPYPIQIIPTNVKALYVADNFTGQVPLGVRTLKISMAGPLYPCNFSLQHQLTSLKVGTPLQKSWLDHLPNTLETLKTVMTVPVWTELLLAMSEPTRLPNLRYINMLPHDVLPADAILRSPLPPQLRKLVICDLALPAAETLDETLLLNLRSSHLQDLSISFQIGALRVNHIGFFALLNALPSKLKILHFKGYHVPSSRWPVALPSTLTDFDVGIIDKGDATGLLEGWLGQLKVEDENQTPPFKLPDSLTRYQCFETSPYSLLLESFPPFLSALDIEDWQLRDKYFASRVPPSPSMILDVPK